MTTVWRRQTHTSFTTTVGSWWIDAIPAGSKYVRCRFRWGFYGDSPFEVDIQSYSTSIITMGLCTTYGNGTETPPNPRTNGNDQAPPAQRWIYWETRGVYPTAMSKEGGVITWRDTGSTEETDTKSQVLAAAPPAGDTLNLWASWALAGNWSGDAGNSSIWIGISDLVIHP
jgi:hypothetical protein